MELIVLLIIIASCIRFECVLPKNHFKKRILMYKNIDILLRVKA